VRPPEIPFNGKQGLVSGVCGDAEAFGDGLFAGAGDQQLQRTPFRAAQRHLDNAQNVTEQQLAVFFGFVRGKPIGILLFSWLAVRLCIAIQPPELGLGAAGRRQPVRGKRLE